MTAHAAHQRNTVLVIGGTDSSGGAGIGQDLYTLFEYRTHGIPIITAVTAQTHDAVREIHIVPPSTIRNQMAAAMASSNVRAIKIGMLGNADAVLAVAAALPPRNEVPVVLDPVLTSTSGGVLLDLRGRTVLLEKLLPRVTLVTPNIPEAAAILGEKLATDDVSIRRYGARFLERGVAVLLKGGHAEGDEAVDLLMEKGAEPLKLRGPRFPGTVRGTGCALSSAIAAQLAHGITLATACREAKHYVAGLFGSADASL